jgi:hypothetical protein
VIKLKARAQGRLQVTAILLGLGVTLPPGTLTPSQALLREWTLSPAPIVAIGGNGRAETEFFRVEGAWRLSHGAVAIANGGSKEIRVFDERGALLGSFGRDGAGPGEFRQFGWAGRSGDTVVVYDGNLRRITAILFDGPPRLVTVVPVTVRDERHFSVVGRVADGRWLVHAVSLPNVNARGVQRVPGLVGLIHSSAAGTVAWLAEKPDMSVFVESIEGNQKQVSVTPTAFPSSLAMAASGPSIWLGETSGQELVRIDAATGTSMTINLPDAPAPLTQEVIDASRKRDIDVARSQASRDRVELKYSARYLPKHLPAFQSLVAGTSGELWVQRFTPDRAGPAQYIVLAASGRALARVTVPPGFRVSDVGQNYVVGIHKDAEGVETISAYTLTR